MRNFLRICVIALFGLTFTAGSADTNNFSAEQLEVARFWQDMGPTLRDHGIEKYAIRYHEDFRHWDIEGSGRMGTKESAIRAWTGFHEAGHRITCTHVTPISVDFVENLALARLEYEQTDTFADGRVRTSAWRMFDVFKRFGDTWQVLESNMVDITPDEGDEAGYQFHCPGN